MWRRWGWNSEHARAGPKSTGIRNHTSSRPWSRHYANAAPHPNANSYAYSNSVSTTCTDANANANTGAVSHSDADADPLTNFTPRLVIPDAGVL